MLTIIGIDPGTTTGIAAVDLDGEVVAVESRKEMGLSQVTKFIMEKGTPVVVATDVSPAPSFVRRVASAFGAELYVPEKDMSVRRKNRLTQQFSDIELSDHSMDALAAALQAYRSDKEFIEKVRRKTEDLGLEDSEEVMKTALKERKSISKIINRVQETDETIEPPESKEKTREIDWKSHFRKKEKETERLEQERDRLKDYVSDLKNRIEELEKREEKLSSERQSKVDRDRKVRKWKEKYERVLKENKKLKNSLKGFRSNISKHTEALERILSGAELYRICNNKEEVEKTVHPVIFLHRNVREEPPERVTVAAVSKEEDGEFYRKKGIKTVPMEEVPGIKLSNYFITEEENIFKLVDDRTDRFIEWLEGYRDRNDR